MYTILYVFGLLVIAIIASIYLPSPIGWLVALACLALGIWLVVTAARARPPR